MGKYWAVFYFLLKSNQNDPNFHINQLKPGFRVECIFENCFLNQNLCHGNSKEPSSDSFTILGLWALGLAVSNINESPLQANESKTLFLMTSLPYYCIPDPLRLAEIKTYAQKMQDAQVTKSLPSHRDGFFDHTKHMFKLMGMKKLQYRVKNLAYGTMLKLIG